jgi:hypothetical protein
MEWTLRLVGTEIDGQSRSCEVMVISRPDGLGDIAALGLTLVEAKQLPVQVQQKVVAAQAHQRTLFRPDCQSCGGGCHVKGWRPHRIATLFGEVRVKRRGSNGGHTCRVDAGLADDGTLTVNRRPIGTPVEAR